MKLQNLDYRPAVEIFLAEKCGCEKIIRLLEQEWACLKRRDVTGLIALARLKEEQIREVQEIRRKIREWSAKVGWDPQAGEPVTGRRPKPLHGDFQTVVELRQTIDRLKKVIFSLNDRNKRYIEETLKIVEHFFSLLAMPEEKPPVYMRYENGRASTGGRSLISRRL